MAGQSQLVHVMNSEGDNYELMTVLVGEQRRSVIRLGQDRLVEEVEEKQKVSEFLRRRARPSAAYPCLAAPRTSAPTRTADELLTLEVGFRLASAQPAPCVV